MASNLILCIKVIRLKKRIKQSAIAAAIGMSQSSYSMLEQGKYSMRVQDLEKICKTLDISVIELY